jgi:hypothetical protein
MQPLFILIPLVIVLITIFYGVLHALFRSWLDYRVKLAFLDKLERNPQLTASVAEIESVLKAGSDSASDRRQNYAVTGLLLAAIGVACVIVGRLLHTGEIAVGTYLGGFVCVLLGIVVGLLGLLIRLISQGPASGAPAK